MAAHNAIEFVFHKDSNYCFNGFKKEDDECLIHWLNQCVMYYLFMLDALYYLFIMRMTRLKMALLARILQIDGISSGKSFI